MQSQERPFLKPIANIASTSTAPAFVTHFQTSLNNAVENVETREEESVEQSSERMTTLYSKLQQEADKIRKWKIQTELDLAQKEKKLQESAATIESLRKSNLDMQLQNEHLSLKLQDEIANREEIQQKISATRDMCNILKDYAAKVEDIIQKCEAEKTEIKCIQEERMQQYEDLNNKFKQLNITAEEKFHTLAQSLEAEKEDKMKLELDFEERLKKAADDLRDALRQCDEKSKDTECVSQKLTDECVKSEQLQAEYDILQQNLRQTEIISSEKQQKLDQATLEFTALKDSLMKEIDELQIIQQSQNRTIDLQKEELENSLQQLQDIQDKACRSEVKLSEDQQQISQLENKVAFLVHQVQEQEEDLQRTREELREALEREKQSYDKLDKLQGQLEMEGQETLTIRDQLDVVKDQKKQLQQDLEASNTKITSLNLELQNRQQTQDELQTQIHDLETQVTNLREHIKETETTAKEQNAAMTQIQDELLKNKSFKKELEKKTKNCSDLDQKLKDAKADVTAKSKLIKEIEKELASAKKSITQLTTEKEQAAAEHENNRRELVLIMDKTMNESSEAALAQQKELNETARKLKEANEKCRQLDKLQQELGSMTQKSAYLEKDMQSKVSDLQTEVEDLQKKLDKAEKDIEEKNVLLQETQSHQKELEKEQQKNLDKKQNQVREEYTKKIAKLTKDLDSSKEKLKKMKEQDKENMKKIKLQEKENADLQKELGELKEKQSRTDIVESTEKLLPETHDTSPKYNRKVSQAKIQVVGAITNTPLPSQEDSVSFDFPMTPISKSALIIEKATEVTEQSKIKDQDVLKTPSRTGILKTPVKTTSKKRRVVFEHFEDNDSSSELMEVEHSDIGLMLKNSKGVLCTTPIQTKASPRVQSITDQRFGTPIQSTRLPLNPVPRGSPISRLAKKKKLVETPSVKHNIRKTPNRPPGKIFKTSPKERKASKAKCDDMLWIDSDAVFGFGAED